MNFAFVTAGSTTNFYRPHYSQHFRLGKSI